MERNKVRYEIIEGMPTGVDILKLRKSVGWREIDVASMEKGLANSLYSVFVVINKEVIGVARVVGDGSTCFYLQDVIVKPAYQKLGIGVAMMEKIMEYISKNTSLGATVDLMSVKGKEAFYEKFGFRKRPSESFSHGMFQILDSK